MSLSKLDLPSREYIAAHCPITEPLKPVNVVMRKIRQQWKAAGLNQSGKPYKVRRHPELAGIKDRKAYFKAWRELTNYRKSPTKSGSKPITK